MDIEEQKVSEKPEEEKAAPAMSTQVAQTKRAPALSIVFEKKLSSFTGSSTTANR